MWNDNCRMFNVLEDYLFSKRKIRSMRILFPYLFLAFTNLGNAYSDNQIDFQTYAVNSASVQLSFISFERNEPPALKDSGHLRASGFLIDTCSEKPVTSSVSYTKGDVRIQIWADDKSQSDPSLCSDQPFTFSKDIAIENGQQIERVTIIINPETEQEDQFSFIFAK